MLSLIQMNFRRLLKMGEYKKLTFLNVSISKEKVTVFTEKETLLSTNNNIQAYNKLYKALEGQKADIYILDHWGKKIGSSVDKNSFLAILRRWFEN